jgi:exonuclease SbcD
LIELDFGEREQDKCVVMVEARPGQAAKAEWVPLHAGRRLRDVEGTLSELQAMAADLGDDYLRVRVRADGPVPGIAEQVRDALPNAIDVSVVYKREVPEEPAVSRLHQLRPAELFGDFFRQKNGAPPAPELLRLFESVYEEATHS